MTWARQAHVFVFGYLHLQRISCQLAICISRIEAARLGLHCRNPRRKTSEEKITCPVCGGLRSKGSRVMCKTCAEKLQPECNLCTCGRKKFQRRTVCWRCSRTKDSRVNHHRKEPQALENVAKEPPKV